MTIATRRATKSLALTVFAGMLAASCGGSDDTASTEAPSTDAPVETTGATPDETSATPGVVGGTETFTFEHSQGTTDVPVDPKRSPSGGLRRTA